MGERLGSRIVVGAALVVVAALGMTQPGASAESDPDALPQVLPTTACPAPQAGSGTAPSDDCEPPDPCERDADGDGVPNCEDNCRTTFNPVQEDSDLDGIGDACDPTPYPPTTPPTTEPPTTPPTTEPPTVTPTPTPTPTSGPTSTPTSTAGPVLPGCQFSCAYPRQVDLRVAGSKLRGTVSSTADGCRASAAVTLWRQRSGADSRLVVLSSRASGRFATKRPARPGRYYVTVASPEQPLCGSPTSATVKVRRG